MDVFSVQAVRAAAQLVRLRGLLESFRYSVTTFADNYSDALVVQSRDVRLPYSHTCAM